ncbi:hypothetical protein EVAR_97195_1 [Eumeta japonica]|uniref:Uncharacterized protein n=1 Tax=Eumeta variegata TaxID=151549 RepID=A0A4C1WJ88_EUMVA|nr:hypothetical protein EVAR_97195_1 [Eumeta japonica]
MKPGMKLGLIARPFRIQNTKPYTYTKNSVYETADDKLIEISRWNGVRTELGAGRSAGAPRPRPPLPHPVCRVEVLRQQEPLRVLH